GNPSDLGAQPSYSTTGGGWIKDGHFNAETAGIYTLTMSVGSVSGTATVTVVEAGTDLVSNGDFNNGTTNWLIDGYNGASVSGYVNNGEYTAAISNGGTKAWTIQMKQNAISLVQGRQYTIRFDARAASNRTVDVKLETDGSPWDNYGNLSPTAITTTMATYEHTFTMNTTDLNARLVLNLGGNSADVVFDNIEVIEVP
ncbi:MAG: carbohydrate binding domain-containing protein, partial [Fibrobacterales bacterium]